MDYLVSVTDLKVFGCSIEGLGRNSLKPWF